MPSRCSRSPTPALAEQIDRALLQHAGADTLLDIVAAARLEHDRLDARDLEQPRQREPGGAGADDPDLGPRSHARAPSWRWASSRGRERLRLLDAREMRRCGMPQRARAAGSS